MGSSTSTRDDDVVTVVDRQLTRLIALCGVGIGVLWAVETTVRDRPVAAWWIACYIAYFVSLLVLAVLVSRLSTRALRTTWIAMPLAGVLLQVLTFPAQPGPFPHDVWEFTWTLTGVHLSFLVLTQAPGNRFIRINLIACVMALAPALSFWIATGTLSWHMAVTALIQFTNVTFAMLLTALRTRLVAYRRLQHRWRQRAVETATARERLREERRLGRLIHDNVLGVLTAAAWTRGRIDEDLRRSALGAVTLLDDAQRSTDGRHDIAQISAVLSEALLAIDPHLDLTVNSEQGELSEESITPLLEAGIEALRNSVTHAPQARRTVQITLTPERIDVAIADDGPGFRIDDVAPDRLGVSQSIRGRLDDLPGGAAFVTAAPGMGTSVRLRWVQKPVAV